METKDYDLEIKKAIDAINETKAKKVLVQLPEGLKPLAIEIVDQLKETGAEITVWAGTCFGACDTPNVKDFDLLIQFGHSEFKQLE